MINPEKSQSQAVQMIEFLGYQINSREMTFRLPQTRVKQIQGDCKKTLLQKQLTVRELARIVSVLAATRLAVLPAPLHYRALQAQKINGLYHPHSYESTVILNTHCWKNLQWWISSVNGRLIQHTPPTMVIESDASNTR